MNVLVVRPSLCLLCSVLISCVVAVDVFVLVRFETRRDMATLVESFSLLIRIVLFISFVR